MAKQRIIHLIDDLDGGTADETIRFAIDEQVYEIDLSAVHAKELRATLDRYQERGRRLGRARLLAPGERPKGPRQRGGNGEHSRARAWAKQNGYPIQPQGRVPKAIIERYQQAGAAA